MNRALRPLTQFLILAAIVFATFGAGLNNGFISDDFVFLERANSLFHNPLFLFSIPPENFRTVSYLFFLVLETTVGFHPWVYYGLTLLFHAVNAFLFSRLLSSLGLDASVAFTAAVLFAAFQRPQEAFLWLSGAHELFQGTTILLFLLFWFSGRRGWAVLCYALALQSKESAPIALLLLPVGMMISAAPFRWRREFLWLGALTAWHGLLLIFLWNSNTLIAGGLYSPSFGAVEVLLRSLNRLALPWLYAFLALALITRARPDKQVWNWILWIVVAHLPYLFLTYQNHVPSRHQYLASLGLAAALAVLLDAIPGKRARVLLLGVFVLFNAGYVWSRKDAQFELRAAPTQGLLQFMRSHPPGELRLEGFPLNPHIARLTTRLVEGWDPEMLRMAELGESCQAPNCPRLVWSEETASYRVPE